MSKKNLLPCWATRWTPPATCRDRRSARTQPRSGRWRRMPRPGPAARRAGPPAGPGKARSHGRTQASSRGASAPTAGLGCAREHAAAGHFEQRTLRRHRPCGRARHAARRGAIPGLGAHHVPPAEHPRRLVRASPPAHPPGLRQTRNCWPALRTRSGPGTSPS